MKDSAKICCCSLLAANSPTHHFLLETNMSKGQFKQSRLGRLSEISGSFRSGWSDQTFHLEMYHPTNSCIKDSCRWLMVGLLLQFNSDSEYKFICLKLRIIAWQSCHFSPRLELVLERYKVLARRGKLMSSTMKDGGWDFPWNLKTWHKDCKGSLVDGSLPHQWFLIGRFTWLQI